MIALAVVAMAIATQAATYNWTWGVGTTSPLAKPGTDGTAAEDFVGTGTAYLFAGLSSAPSAYEQTSSVVTGGTITKVNWNDSRTAGTSVDWYMIVTTKIGDDDYLFISDSLTKARQADGKNVKVTFNLLDDSKAAAMQASGGYAGAGWYAVPEPTSGLLMLLGMAGLALKRKRA